MFKNKELRLIVSDEDAEHLRKIFAMQAASSEKPSVWKRYGTVFVYLVLFALLTGGVVLGQTELVSGFVSDFFEMVLKI